MTAQMILALLVFAQTPTDSGAALYGRMCVACHGADAHGHPAATTRLAVPPADLADCAASSSETEDQWTGVVLKGGSAYGLSLDMPAFGEAITPEDARRIIRYVRSLCREPGWPPGELNFPRAFVAEKAYPENELVATLSGREQELIYERRIGRRAQIELNVGTVLDSLDRPFDHSAEPYVAVGAEPVRGLAFQGQVIGSVEEGEGYAALTWVAGVGRRMGRVAPELEATGTAPRGGGSTVTLVPQLWMQLSRLGHVAMSLGLQVPVKRPDKRAKLAAFMLWDYGDAGLLKGW